MALDVDKAIAYYERKRDSAAEKEETLRNAAPGRMNPEDAMVYTTKWAVQVGRKQAFEEVVAMMKDLKRLQEAREKLASASGR